MFREPLTMARLHRIREEYYEETRDKNLEEVLREMTREAEEIKKKHKLNLNYAAHLGMPAAR